MMQEREDRQTDRLTFGVLSLIGKKWWDLVKQRSWPLP